MPLAITKAFMWEIPAIWIMWWECLDRRGLLAMQPMGNEMRKTTPC